MISTIYEQICWLLPKNRLSVFIHLAGLVHKGIKLNQKLLINQSNFLCLKNIYVCTRSFFEKEKTKPKENNLTQGIYFTE